IAEDRDKRKEACYSAAHMRAMAGWIQTSSGFHAEAEFDETNRAIGKFASSCERAERKVARLVLRYSNLSMTEEQLRDAFSVAYPRNFGLHNIDEVQKRVKERLELGLGQDDAEKAIFDLYSAQYPREPKDDLEAAAKKAAADYIKGKQPPPMLGAVPTQVSERLKAALAAKGPKPKQLPPGQQANNQPAPARNGGGKKE
ncbi:MAG TPA: hypothetical protein VLC10_03940, partial [Patescibacteria group bacterium]|nr:hypothetical protein [Patescibacteria group bacterium]